jgi:hypothetical protein
MKRAAAVPRRVSETIWIPRRAPNMNDLIRAHGTPKSRAYQRLKKSWAQTVELCSLKCPVKFNQCAVAFEIVEPDARRDPDNLVSGTQKLVLDGLVKAGVLAGDGWKHITGLSFSWRVGTPVGVRVVLTYEGPARHKRARRMSNA